MSEKEPTLRLTFNGDGEMEVTPEQVIIYTFVGRTAIGSMMLENSVVNHAFVKTGEENGDTRGLYLFEQFHPQPFEVISEFAYTNDSTLILNARAVAACDLRVYMAHQDAAAENFAAVLDGCEPDDFK